MGFDFIVIAPLLPSHCGFSFVFRCGVSFLVSSSVFLSMTVQQLVVIPVLLQEGVSTRPSTPPSWSNLPVEFNSVNTYWLLNWFLQNICVFNMYKEVVLDQLAWPEFISHTCIKILNVHEEIGTLVQCWWGCQTGQPLWKTVWQCLKKLKIEFSYSPAIPLLGI